MHLWEKTRAKQAIDGVLQKYLETLGPRYQVDSVEVVVRGEWAHGVANWKSQAKALNEPIHILARRLPNGTWVALMPNVDGLYPQWLDAIPESLVPATTKGTLRSQVSTTDVSRRSSTNLTLPTPAKSPVFLNKESSDTRVTPIPKSLELEKTPAQ